MLTLQQMSDLSVVIKTIGQRTLEFQQYTESDEEYETLKNHIDEMCESFEDSIILYEGNGTLNENQSRLLSREFYHFIDACEDLGKFLPESDDYPIRKLIFNTSDSLVASVTVLSG